MVKWGMWYIYKGFLVWIIPSTYNLINRTIELIQLVLPTLTYNIFIGCFITWFYTCSRHWLHLYMIYFPCLYWCLAYIAEGIFVLYVYVEVESPYPTRRSITLDLLHFRNYFLSFGANSELLGEVTWVTGLGIIPEHLTLESSLSIWTWSDLGVDPKHLHSGSARALGPQSLSRALGLGIFPSFVSLSRSTSLFWFVTFLHQVKADMRMCWVVTN